MQVPHAGRRLLFNRRYSSFLQSRNHENIAQSQYCARATTGHTRNVMLACLRDDWRRVRTVFVDRHLFFARLGKRVRELRTKRGYSQEDMISFGFSARHWQQIEAGRPITVGTLLRICAALEVAAERLIRGLDKGIYEVRGDSARAR